MPQKASVERLTGRDDTALITDGALRLLPAAAAAFARLADAARSEGFELRGASAYRSFERQRSIWNRKLCGELPVLDDRDCPVDTLSLPVDERLCAVLRFSALPGASRHHWGTDVDVYDAAAVPADYRVQLTVDEVKPGGAFASLHEWLDERIAAGESYGFFRPYDRDRGGVAPERWHLSFAPLAEPFSEQLNTAALRSVYRDLHRDQQLMLQDAVEARLPEIFARFVSPVARAPSAARAYDADHF